MARAAIQPGKTFDCEPSGLAGEGAQSSVARPRTPNGSPPRILRLRRHRRDGRQDPTAVLHPRRQVPRQPLGHRAGIFAATLANHFVAAFLGDWVAAKVAPDAMRWILGVSFLGFAVWALIPDKLDDGSKPGRFGPFATTLVTFFLAEMGDKTQLATIALAAKYASLAMVVLGTTLGHDGSERAGRAARRAACEIRAAGDDALPRRHPVRGLWRSDPPECLRRSCASVARTVFSRTALPAPCLR